MRKIFDLHNDFLTEIKSAKGKLRFLRDKKLSMVDTIISAIWTSDMSSYDAMRYIESANTFIRAYNSEEAGVKLKLAIEDLHIYSKNNLDKIINISPAYCSLTWNSDNCLAGGAIEGGDLTTLGIDVIRELEASHIQVDTAHLSERSFMSFCSISERPLLCSHSAVASLKSHNRNLKDYQIKMIVESEGLIGLAFVKDFLTEDKKAQIGDIARHIDYIVSRFGDDNISLGTDFYGTKNLPRGIKNYNNLVLLEERLKYLGYTDQTIDKIFYKNAQKFFNNNM